MFRMFLNLIRFPSNPFQRSSYFSVELLTTFAKLMPLTTFATLLMLLSNLAMSFNIPELDFSTKAMLLIIRLFA